MQQGYSVNRAAHGHQDHDTQHNQARAQPAVLLDARFLLQGVVAG